MENIKIVDGKATVEKDALEFSTMATVIEKNLGFVKSLATKIEMEIRSLKRASDWQNAGRMLDAIGTYSRDMIKVLKEIDDKTDKYLFEV